MATDRRRAYRLRYITALYGFDCEQDHIAVGDTAEARSKLQAVGAQIAGLQTFRKDLLANVHECEKTLKRHRDDCCPVLERLEKPRAQEERTTS